MKVIILAGGFGTRLAEYTELIPKPMVEIGGKPIIWHIMNSYSKYGYKDFVIALGYKADIVKKYFLNYFTLNNDFSVNLKNGKIDFINKNERDWKISLIDTGLNSMTGGRVKLLEKIIDKKPFMLTYGDAVSNVNIKKLVDFHTKHKKIGTITAVHPPARFGELTINSKNEVTVFKEKPQTDLGWINGGFFIFNHEFFKYIENDLTVLEKEPLELLSKQNNLVAFKHDGFWQSMDTVRDKKILESIWNSGNATW